MKLVYEHLLEFAKSNSGMKLSTLRGREFEVRTHLDSIVFVPDSTKLGRSDGRRSGERFLERYNGIRSPRPGDYQEVTYNASYYLALVQVYEAFKNI